MANLSETDEFPEGVYMFETTDVIVGGMPNEATGAGMDNIPHLQLAKRTRWLKGRVDGLLASVVAATTAVAGVVKLSTATNSTSTTLAATPSAVKAAFDNAETRALKATAIATAGLASGGGTLAADRTITVTAASQALAEAGTDNTVAMTPLRTAQAIAARVAAGSVQAGSAMLTALASIASNGIIARTAAGTVVTRTLAAGTGITVTDGDGVAGNPTMALSIATQAEAEAGTISTKAMTPLRAAQAIAAKSPGSLAAVGWQKLPSGLIMQWGVVSGVSLAQVYQAVTFPVAFPSAILSVQVSAAMTDYITDNIAAMIRKGTLTTTGMTIYGDHATVAGTGDLYWFALGY